MQDDLRRSLEEIKLRAPVEDVVREYVPALRKSGALWVACCPFHDEKTPSFKVDPRRGTWHCFGACSEGGDQIRFIERFCGLSFLEAVELLAARAGVALPTRSARRSARKEHAAELDALERAARFFEETLRTEAGREARAYLSRRGLADETLRVFRVGVAPSGGQALLERARRGSVPREVLERAGLVRQNDRGHAYDFFRGRLMIPIRDLEGRVVGFGARKLDDDTDGPKYVNSPETELFRKSRLVYGLDLAVAQARRSGRLVLVEGYTDVMAAHQVGLCEVVAVLGISTTDEHTGLVRRAGARRVTLVFDGDEAGRKAAFKALHGLLSLEIELQVVTLPGGDDPCDLLTREGAEPSRRLVDGAPGWFDFACGGLDGLRGAELSREVDRLLELLSRLRKPVHREGLLEELGRRLGVPAAALRDQYHGTRPVRRPGPRVDPGSVEAPAGRAAPPGDARSAALVRSAYENLARAVLLDEGLVPVVRPWVGVCPDPDLKRILEVVLELYEDEDSSLGVDRILTRLAEHPARRLVSGLVASPYGLESPKSLLEGELEFLRRRARERRSRELARRILELQLAIDQERLGATRDDEVAGGGVLESARRELEGLRREHAELMAPARASAASGIEESPSVQSR